MEPKVNEDPGVELHDTENVTSMQSLLPPSSHVRSSSKHLSECSRSKPIAVTETLLHTESSTTSTAAQQLSCSDLQPKALFFDVFGTLVEWRTTVALFLGQESRNVLRRSQNRIPHDVCEKAKSIDWTQFTSDWRASYYSFTRDHQVKDHSDPRPMKSIDQHHLESLTSLLHEYSIGNLWSDKEIHRISRIWHQLPPHSDTRPGLQQLRQKGHTVSTLSNGNTEILNDLAFHGNLPFHHQLSAAEFGAYKPHPAVYKGAMQCLRLQPEECAMVAAHLGDLKAAKSQGMKTVYIERQAEETWEADMIQDARTAQWVDLWIDEHEKTNGGGILELATQLPSHDKRPSHSDADNGNDNGAVVNTTSNTQLTAKGDHIKTNHPSPNPQQASILPGPTAAPSSENLPIPTPTASRGRSRGRPRGSKNKPITDPMYRGKQKRRGTRQDAAGHVKSGMTTNSQHVEIAKETNAYSQPMTADDLEVADILAAMAAKDPRITRLDRINAGKSKVAQDSGSLQPLTPQDLQAAHIRVAMADEDTQLRADRINPENSKSKIAGGIHTTLPFSQGRKVDVGEDEDVNDNEGADADADDEREESSVVLDTPDESDGPSTPAFALLPAVGHGCLPDRENDLYGNNSRGKRR